jgi:hypothetical protein
MVKGTCMGKGKGRGNYGAEAEAGAGAGYELRDNWELLWRR